MELARNLKTESVSRLAPSRPLLVEPASPVSGAVALMRKNSAGCVLVCEARKLVGIFTERDLLLRVIAAGLDGDTPVRQVMTPDPIAVQLKDPINQAIKRFQRGDLRHLPVVDETGRPIGMLSVKRVVHYLVEHFPATVYNLPPTPRAWPAEREGA